MGLRRRAAGPRRVVLAVEMDDGSILADTAVDVDASDIRAYKDSLYDPKHLKFHPGEEPSWFTFQQLTRMQKDAMAELPNNRVMAGYAMRCTCTAHSNYVVERDDGTTYEPAQPKRINRGRQGEMASDAWLDGMNLYGQWLRGFLIMIIDLSEPRPFLSTQSKARHGPEAQESAESTQPSTDSQN